MSSDQSHIRFDAPAMLRKWPSRNNEPVAGSQTYLVLEGTLDDCIRGFMAKPDGARHLYEIHTSAQLPAITEILSPAQITELARFRTFL